ncbi:DUF456 domain-containing protein [Halovivax sp.]|uniref:DUF456 domain-containing protein n=1 Tax=Halovivax sp. TaxID=1935978 RepID=UPI0025BBC545|nr:DUF456 domain-containing protein [Halovivax sp.]
MVDVLTVVAIGLLVAGVLGTLVPLVPGGLLSLSGVYLYWWHADFAEPGLLALIVLTLLGGTTVVVEFAAGALASRAGGASWRTTGIALVVGIVLTFAAGPLGLVAGLFGTVFALELVDGGRLDRSARAAAYATLGVLASTALQVALTSAMLLGFLLAVFVL